MKIGILLTATAKTGDLGALAREVEQLGYESLWIPEHPIIPVSFATPFIVPMPLPEHYRRWVDPLIALTIAAQTTTKLKLGTGILLLPEREPIVTAKALATLDFYSQGRVLLGVGGGWLKEETELMGVSFGLRWRRLRESVEAMRALWTQSQPSYAGELVKFAPVVFEPKPVQASGPPILLGAHGPKSLERVARYCDGWMPGMPAPEKLKSQVQTLHTLCAAHGRRPEQIDVSPIVSPGRAGLTRDALLAWRDAGANRLVLFDQRMGAESADGRALELVRRLAPIAQMAQAL